MPRSRLPSCLPYNITQSVRLETGHDQAIYAAVAPEVPSEFETLSSTAVLPTVPRTEPLDLSANGNRCPTNPEMADGSKPPISRHECFAQQVMLNATIPTRSRAEHFIEPRQPCLSQRPASTRLENVLENRLRVPPASSPFGKHTTAGPC